MSQTLQTTMQSSQNLCDYCHLKPRFGQFNYCSKTCAAQAPSKANALGLNIKPNAPKPRVSPPTNNLCDYCKKAPKHPGHDFCGKSCAQSAKVGPQGQPAKVAINTSSPPNKSNSNKPSSLNTAAQAAVAALSGNQGPIDPTQIANLVVQQLQTLLPPASSGPAPAPVANLKAASLSNVPAPISIRSQQQPPAEEEIEVAECLIPGCNQPVYVDAQGNKSSAFCSMRHRQEAVDAGLVSPCIFCLQLPQSDTDYFCSKECRDESMNKEKYQDAQ